MSEKQKTSPQWEGSLLQTLLVTSHVFTAESGTSASGEQSNRFHSLNIKTNDLTMAVDDLQLVFEHVRPQGELLPYFLQNRKTITRFSCNKNMYNEGSKF